MLTLLVALAVLTFAAPAVFRLRPRLAPLLALAPLAAGAYLAWLASRPELDLGVSWAPALGIRLSFTLDGLAMLFVYLICGIGAVVFLFASAYLKGDPRLGRFFCFLLLFFGSMLGLVVADNVILLFVFWELTSLSSFLLIGYEHERTEAREAALQTLLVTGLGGLALLAGLLILASAGNTFELSELLAGGAGLRNSPLYAPATVLIALGAFAKSAQFPFHFWLPSAMEAPVPVSAYLHSATMVKAGVYLLARLCPLLGGTVLWTTMVAGIGLVSMFLGFLMAFPQRDAKRMLAFSTIGTLGMLTMLIGLGTPAALHAAIALLLAHALYKSSLFLVAGTLDHALGTRDVYRWRGTWASMRSVAIVSLLAAGSLAGLPPLFGSAVKEQVLAAVWTHPDFANAIAAAICFAGMLSVAIAGILALSPLAGKARMVHPPGLVLWGAAGSLAAMGLIFGVSSELAYRSLVTPAVGVLTGHESARHLASWNGFGPPPLLSLAILLGGCLIYAGRRHLLHAIKPLHGYAKYGPDGAYRRSLAGLFGFARRETRLLQSGKLSNYLFIVLLTAVILGIHALASRGGLTPAAEWQDIRPHEAILAAMMAAATAMAALVRSRLAAVAALGVVGLSVSLIFLLFGAPELAITQFLIDTLTVILLVLVLYRLPRFASMSSAWMRLRSLAVSAAAGGLIALLVIQVTGLGHDGEVAAYYTDTSAALAHGHNIVNVILVDFRSLDTLGEITVLAVAAVGVFALLKLRWNRGAT